MQFSRVITPIEDIQIWSASGDGFSFVISYESRGGAGLQGNPGFVASWRPIYQKPLRREGHRLAIQDPWRSRASL
jgi:hypothetical protein